MIRNNKAKGISLIMLIITIIVVIILAGAVILSLSKNNPIKQANEAVYFNNIKTLEEVINLHAVSNYTKVGLSKYPLLANVSNADGYAHPQESAITDGQLKDTFAILQNKYTSNGQVDPFSVEYDKIYILDLATVNFNNNFGTVYLTFNDDYSDYTVVNSTGIDVAGRVYYTYKNAVDAANSGAIPPQIITSTSSSIVYKLYNNGELYGVGQKNMMLNLGSSALDAVDSTVWKEFVSPIPNTKEIVPGNGVMYVIDNNNEVWAWGSNTYDKLGKGNTDYILEPVKLSVTNVKKVFPGLYNTWIVDNNNEVWAAGRNLNGQLGLGNTNIYSSFQKIPSLTISGKTIVEIQSMGDATVVVYNDKTILAAGKGAYGNFALGNTSDLSTFTNIITEDSTGSVKINKTDIKQVLNIGAALAVLKNDGTMYIAGYRSYDGGIPGTYADTDTKKLVQFTSLTNINKIAGRGSSTAFILLNDGSLYATGTNAAIVGDGTIELKTTPTLVPNVPADLKDIYINYGGIAYYITNSGDVYATGKDLGLGNGVQSGESYTTIQKLNNISNINNAVGGIEFNCTSGITLLKDKNNKIYATGDRKLIYRSNAVQRSFTRVLSNIRNITYQSDVTPSVVYIDTNYKMYGWGDNSYGILGLGNTSYVSTPTINSNYSNVIDVNFNDSVKILTFRTNIGDMYSVGEGTIYGIGGWGTYLEQTTPVKVISNVKKISGNSNYITLLNDGTVFGWGRNYYNSLANGKGGNLASPEKSTLPSNIVVKDVKTKSYATYLLTEDGNVYSCGRNDNNGSVTSNTSYQQIPELTNIKSIYTYSNSLAYALTNDGKLYGWIGTAADLCIGTEDLTVIKTPQLLNLVAVSGETINNIQDVYQGQSFTIIKTSEGKVYAWGDNSNGSFGPENTNTNYIQPVRCPSLEN